ncbi:MAG: hydrogenase accessory protein HypB [Planctomycetaceae bacterium]|nr:hydrogenase accessory protein HypB [Planctomycetaceae bacterium]
MCATCGCSEEGGAVITNLQTGERFLMHDDHDHPINGSGHVHDHAHAHMHTHGHTHGHSTLQLHEELLTKNNVLAERNRGWFDGRNILALNLVSSPGSGKTTLLERTIRDLGSELSLSVIEGDQETANDAERIRATGCKVVQINTGTGCHLDAAMVSRGLKQLDPASGSVVLIENVGNLVCPALFDLGERAKVVVVSVTEGEDKPIKYPHMFRASELMLLNKIDLLPYVKFDVERCLAYARQVNPRLHTILISATRGDGLQDWYAWLRTQKN